MMRYVVLLFAMLSVRCELFAPHLLLEVIVPPLPDPWRGIDIEYYTVRWWDDGVRKAETRETRGTINVPKMSGLAVTITPVYRGQELLPAAAVFPFDLVGSSQLLASWEHGPLGAMLLALSAQSFPVHRLNIARFIEAYADFDDPWLVDQERIVQSIITNRFFAPVLRAREVVEVALDLRSGEWIPGNPFHRGGDTLHVLPVGAHRWIGPSGIVIVYVSAGGQYYLVSVEG